jgi:hypothetical protein
MFVWERADREAGRGLNVCVCHFATWNVSGSRRVPLSTDSIMTSKDSLNE